MTDVLDKPEAEGGATQKPRLVSVDNSAPCLDNCCERDSFFDPPAYTAGREARDSSALAADNPYNAVTQHDDFAQWMAGFHGEEPLPVIRR